MLTAYLRRSDGSAETLTDLDALARAWPVEGGAIWVDIDRPERSTLERVGAIFQLEPESIEDCLSGTQRPRVDEFDDEMFLVLYGMLGVGGETSEFAPRKLAAFCGASFLVTVHSEPLLTIQEARERCGRHPAQTLGRGTDHVLYTIIDSMVDKYLTVVEAYEERLDGLEEASLDPASDGAVPEEMTALRRDLQRLRHLTASQRELLIPIARGEMDHISESLEPRFAHVRDHLTQVLDSIERHRDMLGAIHENFHYALAARLNRTMRTLTLFSTLLLPLSLVAGIYGMNLPLWPPSHEPWSFWAVLGGMGCLAIGLAVYFRRRRWL